MNMEIELTISKEYYPTHYSFSEKGQVEEHSELMDKLMEQIRRGINSRPISELNNIFGSTKHKNITTLDIINGLKSQPITMSVCIGDILEDDLPYSSENIKRLKHVKNMLLLNPSWTDKLISIYKEASELIDLELYIKSFENMKTIKYHYWTRLTIPQIHQDKIEYYPENVFHQKVLDKISIILKQGYDVKTMKTDDGMCIHIDNRNFKQR